MCITSLVGGTRKQGVILLGAVTCIQMSTNTHWSYQTPEISNDTLTTSHGVISSHRSSLDVETIILTLLDSKTVHSKWVKLLKLNG